MTNVTLALLLPILAAPQYTRRALCVTVHHQYAQ
jgi:hypothetical protein